MPRPYYEEGGITIYHGDCREIAPCLAGVDGLVSDPPYGIQYVRRDVGGPSIHSRRHRTSERVVGDEVSFDPSPWLAFRRIALFGAQHYADRLPAGGSVHVWDKRGGYEACHLADFDLVWINRKTVGRLYRCVWRGLCREVEQCERIEHPTQKPVSVMAWVLSMVPAAITLDPFLGSGTTLVAAKRLGRRAIGIEIDEQYCEIAAKRLAQGVLPMCGPPEEPETGDLFAEGVG